MKKSAYLLIVLFLVAGSLPLCAQDKHQRALYNYRNDGEFNAFLDIDVDSITYSCIDTLGVEHDEVVVQEVWTSDSLYRIPLEAIDSIGFWAPKPEMSSNIFYLRDYHASFTTSIDGLTLRLANTINRDSIPNIGQVVLSATDKSPYEEGFAGKVADVQHDSKGITILCEGLSIADIYKRLVVVGKVSNDVERYPSHIRKKGRASEPWVNIEDDDVIPIDLDPIEFPIGDLVKITSPTPKLTCTYYVYISELYYEGSVKLDLHHPDLTYNFTFSIAQLSKYLEFGKLFAATFSTDEELHKWLEEYKEKKVKEYLKEEDEYEKDLSKKWFERSKIKIPIPTPTSSVLNLELEISPLVKTRGNLEVSSEFKTDAWQSMSMKWKGFTPLKIITLGKGLPDIPEVNVSAHQDPFKSAKLDLKAKGTLAIGFKTLLNVNLIHKSLLYLGLACDAAIEAGGTIDVTVIDTERPEMNLYDRLRDTNIKVSTYARGYGEAGLTPYKWLSASTPKANLFIDEKVYNILPYFTEPELPKFGHNTWLNKNPLSFYTNPSKDIFIPCKIGMRITDTDGNPLKEYINTNRYLDEQDWVNTPLDIDISDLPRGASYKCYPIISFFGWKPFNAGPVHNFTVPLPLVASPSELTLPVGGSAFVDFFGGWDTFAVVISGDDEVASIVNDDETDARHIKIKGEKEGTSELKIEDRRTGEIVKVPITVTNEPVSHNSIKVMQESINFGEVVVEASERRYLTIVNNGTELEDVNVKIGDPYLLSNYAGEYGGGGRWNNSLSFSLDPNSQKVVVVHFNPTAVGSYNSAITVTSNGIAGGKMVIPVYASVIVAQEDPSFHLSTNSIDVYVNDFEIVEIYNGSGEYDIINNYSDIVESDINVPHVAHIPPKHEPGESGRPNKHDLWNITGKKVGKAVLKVKDKQTNEVLTLNVEVKRAPSLSLSAHIVEVAVDEYDSSIEINAGSGWYNITSENPEIATAERYDKNVSWVDENGEAHGGTFVEIKGLKSGSTKVIVKDMSSGETATINVTVTGENVPVQTETITIPGTNVSFKMVAVEGGTFWMGLPDDDPHAQDEEKPRHQVTLSSFSIGQTEVTQALWEAVMGSNPSKFKGMNRPVEEVSWDDCQEFITKLNQLTGRKFRLPTEAEWEYAARGGNYSHGYIYAGSDDIDAVAWYGGNIPSQYSGGAGYGTQTVATKQPNELGLYDMSGNVYEWCLDWYSDNYYANSPSVNPCNTTSSYKRVDRGGSWMSSRDRNCGVAYRHIGWWGNYDYSIGLRLALSDGGDTPVAYLSCPDGNHPHLIDLGLPSGTKWACCNVGADKPEAYGDYFAWGETQTKNVYNQNSSTANIINCNNEDLNISGTGYDAARVNWGTPWQMPTLDVFKELQNNTTCEWTTLNGVNGTRITGSNGGFIFLPASGYKTGEESKSMGTWGAYWVSSINWWIIAQCDCFHFSSSIELEPSINFGYDGLPIRPVICPNGKPNNDVGGRPSDGDGTQGGSGPTDNEYNDF